jgi:hypothetical protein
VSAYLPYLQSLVGIGLVGYAVYLIGQRAVGLLPAVAKPSAVPVDDVRIVSDLATRLRAQGKTPAVDIALKLHAELLKPEVPTP